jgi:hypothetical protein
MQRVDGIYVARGDISNTGLPASVTTAQTPPDVPAQGSAIEPRQSLEATSSICPALLFLVGTI